MSKRPSARGAAVRRAPRVACWTVASCLIGTSAQAERSQLALSYSAPPSCPDSDTIHANIDRLLGGVAPTSSAIVSADARIEGRPGAFQLRLAWSTTESGDVRVLDAATCEELTQALALIVALAVDPENPALSARPNGVGGSPSPARTEVGPPEVRPPPPAATGAAPPALASTAVTRGRTTEAEAPSASLAARSRPRARAGFQLERGTLPELAAGAFAGLEVPVGAYSLGVSLEALWPQEELVAGRGGKFWMFGVAAEPCRTVRVSPLELAPCLLAELIVMPSSGSGVALPEEASAWFGRFGATMNAAIRVGSAARLQVGAAALVAPVRPSFRLADQTLVHSPNWVAWRATLSAGIDF